MKVFVRNNGKLFGPLDIQRVFDSYDRGVYSDNAALSEDKVEWMSIPEARSLLQQKKLAKENPQPAVAPAPTPIPPQPQYAQQPYGQSPQPMYGQQPQPMGVPPYGQPQFGQPVQAAGYPQTANSGDTSALVIVFCIIGGLAWLLPIIGVPVSIAGLVIGINKKHTTCIVLNSLYLILSIINAIIGVLISLGTI